MDTSSAPTPWHHRISSRLPTIIGNAALIIGFWLALISFPVAPTAGLDPSWRMSLGYAVQHGWQFGKDIVFTYGPLGYLLVSTNSGGLYVQHLVWQLGASLLFALSIWGFGRNFVGWRKVMYFVYFTVFGIAYPDAIHMLVIVLWSLALTRDSVTKRPWLALLISVGLAVMALVKFTNLMLAAVAVLSVVSLYGWRRQTQLAVLTGAGFFGGYVAGWMILGQSVANLPAYIVNSLSVSSGYVEAMSVDESKLMFWYGFIAALSIAVYIGLTLYRAKDLPRAASVGAIAAAAVFLNWKHGFVRADGHVIAHFIVTLFFVCSYSVLVEPIAPLRSLKTGLRLLGGACCVLGVWLNSPVTILYTPTALNPRIVDNGSRLLSLNDYIRTATDQFSTAQRRFALLDSKAVIGDAPVDIFGNEQAYAILTGLNFRARPALQGYAAYNRRLEQLDLDFMASPRGPEYVLQKINGNTIDGRMPSMDDALATRYLYHHFGFVMQENQFLLWKRNPPDPALDERTLVSSGITKFGWIITPPEANDAPLWCEFDIKPSLLGRIRSFFYKPPVLRLSVTDGGNETARYRLVREQASTGFLTYPHFSSNINVTEFQEGKPPTRIAHMSIEIPREHRKYFQREIPVRFYKLPPFTRSMKKANDRPHEVRYRLFTQAPVNVVSPYLPDLMTEMGKDVMLAHPPTSLEFAITAKTHRVVGSFGMISRAYTEGKTDGAEFFIEWVDSNDKTTTLFHRYLQPIDAVEDRGEQHFNITLPPGPGRLFMRTTAGPANNIAFDWTYWTDVKFTE